MKLENQTDLNLYYIDSYLKKLKLEIKISPDLTVKVIKKSCQCVYLIESDVFYVSIIQLFMNR